MLPLLTTAALLPTLGGVSRETPQTSAKPAPPEVLLVHEGGLTLLTPDGRELARLGPDVTSGALSPNGHWLACLEYRKDEGQNRAVLRPRDGKSPPILVPDVAVPVGVRFLPVWSPDSARLILGEDRSPLRGKRQYRHRVYDLAAKKLTELKPPEGLWVTDWSRDGKRLLGARYEAGSSRIAWANADGSGEPEFLSPEEEFAVHPRLSPDGRKVLYKTTPGLGEEGRPRLYVLDLATKRRVEVSEPGEVHGYCWSPDGARLAYTWQRSLKKREEAPERETVLYTCDAAGKDRQKVASRKYRPVSPRAGVVVYFEVVDWR